MSSQRSTPSTRVPTAHDYPPPPAISVMFWMFVFAAFWLSVGALIGAGLVLVIRSVFP